MNALQKHQSRAGKSRMAKLSRKERQELGRKAGLASGLSRKAKAAGAGQGIAALK